jgi:hypothetical protein
MELQESISSSSVMGLSEPATSLTPERKRMAMDRPFRIYADFRAFSNPLGSPVSDEVVHQKTIDGFCRMGHVNPSTSVLEICLHCNLGDDKTYMSMGDLSVS